MSTVDAVGEEGPQQAPEASRESRREAVIVELVIGRVGRAHGLRGEVAVQVRTDEPERRFADGAVVSTDRGRLTIVSTRWNGSRLLVRFDEAVNRESAERLRGAELVVEIDANETPDDPDEFYDHQLIGLRALNLSGAEVGRVGAVLHLPAHDVLVVELDGREALVPFVSAHVPAVDVAGGSLTVSDGSGLLEPLLGDEAADAPEGA